MRTKNWETIDNIHDINIWCDWKKDKMFHWKYIKIVFLLNKMIKPKPNERRVKELVKFYVFTWASFPFTAISYLMVTTLYANWITQTLLLLPLSAYCLFILK